MKFLGRTGVKIARVSLGAMAFGMLRLIGVA